MITLTEEIWDLLKDVNKQVNSDITYMSDTEHYGKNEKWCYPEDGFGDCVSGNEEIYTKNGIGKIKNLQIGDLILSYDFDEKSYCYKPILNIWSKGVLPVFRVTFKNGTWMDVTESHPFWTRQAQNHSHYKKTHLNDVDLTRWWKRKTPCVKKLPYIEKDINWLTLGLCFVIGHFLAEGFVNKGHVRTCGYDVPSHIEPILIEHNIPYSTGKNNSNVPYLTFLSSKFKNYLRNIKINSFNMTLSEEIFHLPIEKLQSLVDGHFLGDGHNGNYKYDNYVSHKERVYSTSCFNLMKYIQRIHLQIGTPLYIGYQKHHQGLGNKPIWRLNRNSKSYFTRDYGYNDISEVSIKKYKYLKDIEVFDLTIKDTQTYINKFGILCHNCEDYAIAKRKTLELNGIESWFAVCKTETGGYHAVLIVKTDRGDFVLDNRYNTVSNFSDLPYEWIKIEGENNKWYDIV